MRRRKHGGRVSQGIALLITRVVAAGRPREFDVPRTDEPSIKPAEVVERRQAVQWHPGADLVSIPDRTFEGCASP